MGRPRETYLDIETDWHGRLTVIGIHSGKSGFVQLIAPGITRQRLLAVVPGGGRLYTFNGQAFDLPRIHKQLGLDLRGRFESVDLRWSCYHADLTGGQKRVEQIVGFTRQTEGMDGREAMALWSRHRRGDRAALKLLLRYNREDLEGMRFIKRRLARDGWL